MRVQSYIRDIQQNNKYEVRKVIFGENSYDDKEPLECQDFWWQYCIMVTTLMDLWWVLKYIWDPPWIICLIQKRYWTTENRWLHYIQTADCKPTAAWCSVCMRHVSCHILQWPMWLARCFRKAQLCSELCQVWLSDGSWSCSHCAYTIQSFFLRPFRTNGPNWPAVVSPDSWSKLYCYGMLSRVWW